MRSPSRLGILRELMNKAVRDCLVTGYEPPIESKSPDGFCSTRSTSTRGSSTPACARSPIPGGTRRTQLTMCSRNSSGRA
jgi:hypothetical protein